MAKMIIIKHRQSKNSKQNKNTVTGYLDTFSLEMLTVQESTNSSSDCPHTCQSQQGSWSLPPTELHCEHG